MLNKAKYLGCNLHEEDAERYLAMLMSAFFFPMPVVEFRAVLTHILSNVNVNLKTYMRH